jgi:hypothetical protein
LWILCFFAIELNLVEAEAPPQPAMVSRAT